jgi:hypothetical protein
MPRVSELSQTISLLRKRPSAEREVLMTRKSHERKGELHDLAAFAHAAAASAHSNGDYASAVELSKQAHAYSVEACRQDAVRTASA